MENSKYKKIIENGEVEEGQLAIIHIPSTLHSDDANHVVTTTDEVYDILLKKRQFIINQEQEEFTKQQEKINQQQEEINQEQKEFSKQQEEINQQQEEFNREQKYINEQQEEINQEQKEFNQQQEEINQKQTNTNKYVKNFIEDQIEINQKQENFNVKQDCFNYKQKKINQEVRLDLDSIKLEIAAAGGDISAIKNILKNYLTKETFEYILEEEFSKLEESLKDFYTKTEVDNKFLELEIDKILNNVSLSMSCSPGSIFEKGISVSHVVTFFFFFFLLSDKTVLSCYIKKNGVIVAESTGSTVSYSDTIVNTVSYSGVVTYKNDVKSWSSSCTRSAYNKTYYGFGLNEEDIFTNGHSKITSSAKGTYSEVSNKDNVYYFIIVPSGVSRPSTFTMNATPFVMNESSLTKNNITYTVLKSGSAFGIGGEVKINAQ